MLTDQQLRFFLRNAINNGPFRIAGGTRSETLTITGASGTLGIDIDTGAGAVAYDEAFDTDIETTIDNWLVSHAASVLTAHDVTATKGSASTILLSGTIRAGLYVFADGGTTMVATSGSAANVFAQVTGPFKSLYIVAASVFDNAGTVVSTGDSLPMDYAPSAGDTVSGDFLSVQLVSGEVLCYLP